MTVNEADASRRKDAAASETGGIGRWIAATAFLVLLTEQTALGFTLIAPTLGQFAVKYETTQVAWMITIFILVAAVLTPVLGKIGDRVGKKRVLVVAGAVGFVGAVVCALAPNFTVMLVGRALMGVSGAFMPLAYALVRDVFPANARNMCIAIVTNGVGVVTIAGPFLAGYLIDNVSLESVFWFVAIISAVGAVGVAAFVPESPNRNVAPMDVPGFLGLALGLLALMYGISNLATWTLTDSRTLTYVGGGFLILVVWWVWERYTDSPFVDTRLLTNRSLSAAFFSYALITASLTVCSSFLPTMIQTPRALGIDYGFGLDATGVAVYFIAGGVLTVAGGILVGAFARRAGFRTFLLLAGVFAIVGTAFLGLLQSESWMPVVGYGLIGLAAMSYAAGAGLIMAMAPPASRGIVAGMLSAVAGAIGSSLTQVCGLILNKNVGQVAGGFPVYTSAGWTTTFLVATAVAVVGTLLCLLVPRRAERLTSTDEELVVKPVA